MTGLLLFTFLISWVHTLLWLPRSFEWRKKLKEIHAAENEIDSDLADKNDVDESSEPGGTK
jgi:hypothetical protein